MTSGGRVPVIHTLEPTGGTGGRAYLRMVHAALEPTWQLDPVPDFKRRYRHRRWRKLRHLARIAPRLRADTDTGGVFLWDDLSLILFTPAMRRRTVYVFHHYEPLQFDSQPVEPLLWQRLFTALRQCAAVVCVAPYWQRFLAQHGVHAEVVYNAFDLTAINAVRAENRNDLRRQFGLPERKTIVYAGKAVHWKGTQTVHSLLSDSPDIHVVTSGNNTIGVPGDHRTLPYTDYLRLLRACDVGVFLPQMHEGWSRCAAETILLDIPCIIHPIAGLADLAAMTRQPPPAMAQLPRQIRQRALTPHAERERTRTTLEHFDQNYFATTWNALIDRVVTVVPASDRGYSR